DDNVKVIPGSAVGDFHHTSSLTIPVVITPSKLPTSINVNSVIANGRNVLPVFQSIASLTIPLTKSSIHSITFCAPVGFIWSFLAPSTDRINTIAAVTMIIMMFDKLTDNQDIPKRFSIIGAP